MDGKTLIESFEDTAITKQVALPGLTEIHREPMINDLRFYNTVCLEELLDNLYYGQEVLLLTDDLTPCAVTTAETTLVELAQNDQFSDELYHRLMNNRLKAFGQRIITDVVKTGRVVDDSDQVATDTMGEFVDLSVENQTRELIGYSAILLANGVRNIANARQQVENGRTSIADLVLQTVSQNRQRLAAVLYRWQSEIDVIRLFDRDSVMSVEVVTRKDAKHHIPKWLNITDDWNHPLHRLCAALSEADTLTALHEWVVKNHLPYIPVMAPISIEQGNQVSGEQNLKSDILLCSLEANDIVPIQVKNQLHVGTTAQYHPEMVFITPHDLGSVKVEAANVRGTDDRVHTGRRGTTTFGRLLTAFSRQYGNKNHHGKPMADAKANFDTAFESFEAKIRPLLKHKA